MGIFLRGLGVLAAAMLATITAAWAQTADPPGRVGRLAFVNGTVSFHDREETNWQPAAINYPMSSGNALWTEPNGRAELFVGGTRIRMQGSTQLETLALTDDQFQLRISQGRIDIKPVGLQQGQQIEILTPRGSAILNADGDYMIEAGTTDDATRVGVRTGSARVIASNGSELIVHAGEIGVMTGATPPVFETVRQATPPMPPEWATRDRQIVTTQTVQYVPATMTGSEELDYYGSWSTVGSYGRVWSPRSVPAGWEPYRQGRWRWVDPWGWTWIDDQPWAFAPSHYGRWVNQGGRWYWVPPAREARPVYAPAVVGFVDVAAGAATLAIAASVGAPVGWFPLGPREVYVPPYTADRAYIRRVNAAYVPNTADIDRRIDYAQRYRDDRRDDPRRADPRRDARPGPGADRDRPVFINQRYATVVPQQAFVRGDRVDRAAIRVDADRLARVQAAPVAAPVVATRAAVTPPAQPGQPAPAAKPGQPPAAAAAPQGADVQRAPLADIPVLGRPTNQDRPTARAPGPQISRTQPPAPGASGTPAERQLPNLRTRDGREVERTAPSQAAPAAPPAKPGEPQKPGEPPKPGVAAPPAKPGEEPKAAEPPKPPQAPATPPVASPPGKPGEQPKAAEPPKPPQAPVASPPAKPGEQPKAAEPPKPPQAPVASPPAKPGEQPKAAEPPKPPQAPATPKTAEPPKPPVTPPQAAEPPKAPVAPPKAAQPPSPPAPPPAQQAKPPEPPHPAPQQAAPPAPKRQAPPPQQAKPPEPPHPAPQQAAPPPPKPQAPPAPPPPQQAKPPAPPAPPPPQQAKPPSPPPQPQAKPPEQAKQPRDKDDKGGDDRRH